jgi:PAS domain S-box-containing protein
MGRLNTAEPPQVRANGFDRFRLAAEGFAGFFYDWTAEDGRIEFFGDMQATLGLEPAAAPNDPAWWRSRIHPDDIEPARRAWARIVGSRAIRWLVEYRIRHEDGRYIDIAQTARIVRDGTGRVARVVAGIRDVSEQARTDSLRDGNARASAEPASVRRLTRERDRLLKRLQIQFERMPIACILFDTERRIIDWNPAAEDMFGYRRDEVVGQDGFSVLLARPSELRGEEIVRRLIAGDMMAHSVNENRTKDGRVIVCDWLNTPLSDDNGAVILFMSMAQDITERIRGEHERETLLRRERAARVAAEAAISARDEIISIVSHDLRSPLGAIALCAGALLEVTDPAAVEQRGILQAIEHAATNTNRLIRDLLDVATMEAGHLSVDLHDSVAAAILAEAAEIFAPVAQQRDITLEIEIDPELPTIRADACRVHQVLANLLSNALKFTERGGRIGLSARRDPHGARFTVEDTGIGIAAADLPHVFDRYWQKRRSGGEPGVGLGLAIVRGVVDAHGGSVTVESTPGTGTIFSFTIPARA